jgi:cytochrome P450
MTTIEAGAEKTPSLMATADHYRTPLGPDGTPYEYYEALRDEAEGTPIAWSEAHGGHWVVGGYKAATQIIKNSKAFSNTGVAFPDFPTGEFRLVMAMYDDPEHKRQRQVVEKSFTPAAVEAFTQTLRQTTNDLIDQRIEEGRADAATWLADEIPARLTAILLGMPLTEGETYRRWVWAITNVADPAASAAVFDEMVSQAREVIAERKVNPGSDVMSSVVQAEIDGERLSDAELVSFFMVLLLGGIENTARFLSSVFWRLAWDVEFRRRLIAHPEILPSALDELLRYYAPAVAGRLVMTEPVTVEGVTMEPGQTAMLWYPVINRDRSVFPNPDNLVIDRSPNRHLAFGAGIHRCLGLHLVRLETSIALGEFLKRIPQFELDPARRTEWLVGQVSGAVHVPIVFPAGKRLGPVMSDTNS